MFTGSKRGAGKHKSCPDCNWPVLVAAGGNTIFAHALHNHGLQYSFGFKKQKLCETFFSILEGFVNLSVCTAGTSMSDMLL